MLSFRIIIFILVFNLLICETKIGNGIETEMKNPGLYKSRGADIKTKNNGRKYVGFYNGRKTDRSLQNKMYFLLCPPHNEYFRNNLNNKRKFIKWRNKKLNRVKRLYKPASLVYVCCKRNANCPVKCKKVSKSKILNVEAHRKVKRGNKERRFNKYINQEFVVVCPIRQKLLEKHGQLENVYSLIPNEEFVVKKADPSINKLKYSRNYPLYNQKNEYYKMQNLDYEQLQPESSQYYLNPNSLVQRNRFENEPNRFGFKAPKITHQLNFRHSQNYIVHPYYKGGTGNKLIYHRRIVKNVNDDVEDQYEKNNSLHKNSTGNDLKHEKTKIDRVNSNCENNEVKTEKIATKNTCEKFKILKSKNMKNEKISEKISKMDDLNNVNTVNKNKENENLPCVELKHEKTKINRLNNNCDTNDVKIEKIGMKNPCINLQSLNDKNMKTEKLNEKISEIGDVNITGKSKQNENLLCKDLKYEKNIEKTKIKHLNTTCKCNDTKSENIDIKNTSINLKNCLSPNYLNTNNDVKTDICNKNKCVNSKNLADVNTKNEKLNEKIIKIDNLKKVNTTDKYKENENDLNDLKHEKTKIEPLNTSHKLETSENTDIKTAILNLKNLDDINKKNNKLDKKILKLDDSKNVNTPHINKNGNLRSNHMKKEKLKINNGRDGIKNKNIKRDKLENNDPETESFDNVFVGFQPEDNEFDTDFPYQKLIKKRYKYPYIKESYPYELGNKQDENLRIGFSRPDSQKKLRYNDDGNLNDRMNGLDDNFEILNNNENKDISNNIIPSDDGWYDNGDQNNIFGHKFPITSHLIISNSDDKKQKDLTLNSEQDKDKNQKDKNNQKETIFGSNTNIGQDINGQNNKNLKDPNDKNIFGVDPMNKDKDKDGQKNKDSTKDKILGHSEKTEDNQKTINVINLEDLKLIGQKNRNYQRNMDSNDQIYSNEIRLDPTSIFGQKEMNINNQKDERDNQKDIVRIGYGDNHKKISNDDEQDLNIYDPNDLNSQNMNIIGAVLVKKIPTNNKEDEELKNYYNKLNEKSKNEIDTYYIIDQKEIKLPEKKDFEINNFDKRLQNDQIDLENNLYQYQNNLYEKNFKNKNYPNQNIYKSVRYNYPQNYENNYNRLNYENQNKLRKYKKNYRNRLVSRNSYGNKLKHYFKIKPNNNDDYDLINNNFHYNNHDGIYTNNNRPGNVFGMNKDYEHDTNNIDKNVKWYKDKENNDIVIINSKYDNNKPNNKLIEYLMNCAQKLNNNNTHKIVFKRKKNVHILRNKKRRSHRNVVTQANMIPNSQDLHYTNDIPQNKLNITGYNNRNIYIKRCEEYLKNMNNKLLSLNHQNTLAEWDFETDISNQTKKKLDKVSAKFMNHLRKVWKETEIFVQENNCLNYSEQMAKQFKILLSPGDAVLPPEDYKMLHSILLEMEAIYSTATLCDYELRSQCTLKLEPDINRIMAESRNPEELDYYWKEWRISTGDQMKDLYYSFVKLSNKAAYMNGYPNAASFWISAYDDQSILKTLQNAWHEIQPLYKELHKYVRMKLYETYPTDMGDNDFIPAHLLGNLWAQTWTNIYNMTVPYSSTKLPDLTDILVKNKYTPEKMVFEAENFFVSLNFSKLPRKFWKNSIIENKDKKQLVCHASAWDMYDNDDFRIKMCGHVTAEDFIVIHHEMGHVYYYLQYQHLPVVYRDGANPGFHEAIGDVIGLSVSTPSHLKYLENQQPKFEEKIEEKYNKQVDINFLYLMALQKIAFLPFAYTVFQWQFDVFSKNICKEEYNEYWWKLRKKYQGIEPPDNYIVNRHFDPGAKYHIAAGVSYMRYFVSFIIQFQFHEALCEKTCKKHVPLHKCDIYGNTEAGNHLKKMLSLGSSVSWKKALYILTGSTEMSVKPLLKYFSPLYKWLKKANTCRNPFY